MLVQPLLTTVNEANLFTLGFVESGQILYDSFLTRLNSVLEEKFGDENFGVSELSCALFLCPMQVHRKVKQRTGLSPGHLLLRYRLLKAQTLLRSTDLPIGEIAWRSGFASQNYFARAYHKQIGYTPRMERQKGDNSASSNY